MNEQTINGLWSASTALANHEPLNCEEQQAVAVLLQKTLGVCYPTKQEYLNYVQDKEVASHYENEPSHSTTKQYFEARKKQYENKYSEAV